MENLNELIVGLDIGSNSVGWAAVTMQGNDLVEIHGMGARIIPSNDDTKNFEQGKAQARNAERRRYRSMRRNNQRYKLRRANLVKVLKLIGAWPEGAGDSLRPADTLLTAMELYGLRSEAVDKPISLNDLGRVLYHMNQRRGYKDIGDLMDELQGKEAQQEDKESNTTVEVKLVKVDTVTVEDAKGKKEILHVRLTDGTEGSTTQSSFKELEGKELYLQIKTRRTGKGDTVFFSRVSVSDWLKNKDELDKKISASRKHPGQYFHQELLDNPDQPPRFRERVVLRERYKDEFDAIWKQQAKAHPVLTDAATRDRVLEVLIPRNTALRAQWTGKDLGTILRDFVIYYQRPLKSQTKNKGLCRFERKPVAPVSSPVYQLFRIWQQVNNIALRDKYMRERALTADERSMVVGLLMEQGIVSEAGLLRALKLSKSGLETNLRADLPGHVTLSKLRNVLGDHPVWSQLQADSQQVTGQESTVLFKLWHALYSIPEQEHRKSAAKNLLGLEDAAAEELAKVRFERKHGAVSARAASRITQLMACGAAWSSDRWSMSLQRRVQHVIDHKGAEDMKPEMREQVGALTSIEQYQGLQYWIAATVAYGDHRAHEGAKLDAPDRIRTMTRGFLRNPTVEQVVNEALMVVRDIWKVTLKGERPTSFRIELARELRQSIDERQRTDKRNRDRERDRKKVVERLMKEHGKARPTGKDIERFELWEQQKYQCIYSGRTIEASQLFSRETDVDHIIPKTLFYDDSLQNKVLCLRTENAAKDNALGAVFMKGKGEKAYDDFVQRISDWNLPYGKRKFLLAEEVPDSFISRQMNETRYIGTELRKLLERIAPVNTTVGQVTDALKNEWGLTTVYKEVLLPRFKRLGRLVHDDEMSLIQVIHRTNGANHVDYKIEGYDKRIDHRHHALDALVVALTRQRYIQKIARLKQKAEPLTQEEAAGKLTWWPLPHRHLRSMVKDQLERTIPSIKNRQRLLTKASNRTAWYDAEAGKVRTGKEGKPQQGRLLAVRGKLHEEQPMGEVRRQERMPIDKVMKRLVEVSDRNGPLHMLRPIAKDDPAYRSRFLSHERERVWLEERLTKLGGDIKAALKDWKKEPPMNSKGEPVLALTVLVPYYASTQPIGGLSPKMMTKILDTSVARSLDGHVAAFDNDYEKALTDDGLNALNDERQSRLIAPLKRVRIKKHDTPIWDTDGHRQLLRSGSSNERLHIKMGDNYALAVHVHLETGERSFDIVSFYDAVQRKRHGLDLIDPRPNHRSFLLRKKDPVYVPRPGELIRDIPWHDTSHVGERLYQVTQFTDGYVYFIRTFVSSVLNFSKQEMEFGSQSATEWEDADDPRTKIKLACIPVIVDRLGRVSPLWP